MIRSKDSRGGAAWVVLLSLLAAILLGGCNTARTPVRPEFDPSAPAAEPSRDHYVHIAGEDPDVRRVSAFSPKKHDPAEKRRFSHPAEHAGVREIFFQDVPLQIAAEMLNEIGGVNLMLQEDVAGRKVRLYLRDVSLGDAVESLLRRNELWFRRDGPVTTVMSQEAYADKIVFQQSDKIQAFFMRYTNARDMAALLATVLAPDVEFRDMSGESVYGHLEVDAEGASPDAGDTMVSIESLNEDDRRRLVQLGKAADELRLEEALNLLGRRVPASITVFKKNNAIVVRATDEGLLRHITGLIREMDTPVRQVLLEMRIVRLDLGDAFESFFDFSLADGGSVDQRRISRDGYYDMNLSTLGGVGELSRDTLAYVFSTDILEARMQLYARENRLNTLSTPFLLAADNAEVRFFVGQQIPLRTGISKETVPVTEIQERVLFIPEVDTREIGTDLELKSFINADRTITMEIDVALETPSLGVSDITLVNELTGEAISFPLDGVDTTELETILAVPSGSTVALGGIIRTEDRDFEQKVPFLGDLPLLGYFFKKVERGEARTETVILITPHIIGHPGEGADTAGYFLKRSSRTGKQGEASLEGDISEKTGDDPSR